MTDTEDPAVAEERNRAMDDISDELLEQTIAAYGPSFTGAVLTMTLGKLLAMMDDDKVEEALAMHCEEAKVFRTFFVREKEDTKQ